MSCVLCEQELPSHVVVDGKNQFCCHGCLTVYKILESKNIKENFQSTPLFQKALESGILSNQKIFSRELPGENLNVKQLYICIDSLWCPSCAEIITLLLQRERGIKKCTVDYATDYAIIDYFPQKISKEKIFALIASLGYTPKEEEMEGKVSFALKMRFAVALFSGLNIMMFSYPLYTAYLGFGGEEWKSFFAWASLFMILPCLFYSAVPIFKHFFASLRVRLLGMEALLTMGLSSAFLLSLYRLYKGSDEVYFDSMSMLIVFVLWGKVIECRAKFSAKKALISLNRSLPKRGRKRVNNEMHFVPLKEIQKGDILVSFTGEKIVLDGIVEEGGAGIDESVITGEALPRYKEMGQEVLAGTLIKSGWIALRVTRTEKEAFIQKIVETLRQDFPSKKKEDLLLQKIITFFVPATLFLATLVALLTHDLIRAIAVLLISCPCAIGIAIPMVHATLIHTLARRGIIVRNRSILPLLGKKRKTLVLDKTGTVTEGTFTLLSQLVKLTEEEKRILKGMASHSLHPVSCAIKEVIETSACTLESLNEIQGFGLRALYNGQEYLLGSARFLDLVKPENPHTVVYFKTAHQIHEIVLGDLVREEAKGFKEAILLSGDNEKAVEHVAAMCGMKQWFAEQDPLQKKEVIEQLKKKEELVVMVGDGINDAPSLTTADIGISLIHATDLAMHVSDILIPRLESLKELFILGRKAQKICSQNLFWAFFYNVIGIALALLGFFPPIIAAAAMTVSSLLILMNSLRLK